MKLALFLRLKNAAVGLMAALWVCTSGIANAATPQCEDFLERIARKPPNLKYVGCAEGHLAQIAVLEAKYRVAGRHAEAVERYFMRYAGMERLRFACCGWEALPNRHGNSWGRLRSGFELDYRIRMGSMETLITTRREWPRIEWFEITVMLPLDSP